MGVIFRIALRNLKQHKSKSIIIGVFICIGVMVVELGNGFLEATNRGLERDFRANYTGDIVIKTPVPNGVKSDLFGVNSVSIGEKQELPALSDIDKVQAVVDKTDGIVQQTRLISSMAYFRTDSVDDDFDPDDDAMSDIPYFFLFSGEPETYFKMFHNMNIIEGTLPSSTENEVLVDVRLRDKFQKYYKVPLKLGDKILVSAFSATGTSREAKVCGFYTQPDENTAMMPLVYATPSLARTFAGLTYGAGFAEQLPESIDTDLGAASEDEMFDSDDGSNASMFDSSTDITKTKTEDFNDILGDTTLRDKLNQTDSGAWNFIILKTTKGVNTDKLIQKMNIDFLREGLTEKAVNWKSAGASFTSTVSGISALFTALVIILAVVVFIIIMNTLIVSVIERTAEIGTMRALGAEKNFVRKLFFFESVTITLISAAAGTILALLIMLIINSFHLTVSGDIAKMLLGGGSIEFIPTAASIIGTILIITIGSVLADIYPVSAALKISPLKALSQDGE